MYMYTHVDMCTYMYISMFNMNVYLQIPIYTQTYIRLLADSPDNLSKLFVARYAMSVEFIFMEKRLQYC